MQVHLISPYRLDRNLGKAYNDAMKLIPDGDWACIMDYDVLLLTPDAPAIMHQYAKTNPGSLLTCYTNRIHPKSHQKFFGLVNENADMRWHLELAEKIKVDNGYHTTPIREHMSGFLMLISKDLWKKYKFQETGHCLGIDTAYFNLLKQNKVPVLRMDGLYVWHTYRLLTGITDKSHLL